MHLALETQSTVLARTKVITGDARPNKVFTFKFTAPEVVGHVCKL